MEVSERIQSEMSSEIVSRITYLEKYNRAFVYDNVCYTVLDKPIKLVHGGRGVYEFTVVGFTDEECEKIVVGNLSCINNKPSYLEFVNEFRNGLLSTYAQLCGIIVE